MLRQQDSSVGILPVRTDQRATLAVLEKRSGRICSRSGGILQGNCKGRWLRWTEDGEVGDEILDQDRDSGKGHEKHGENQRSGRVHFRAFVATGKSQYEAGEAQACAEAAQNVRQPGGPVAPGDEDENAGNDRHQSRARKEPAGDGSCSVMRLFLVSMHA